MKTPRWIPVSAAGVLILLLALAGCGATPTPLPTPTASAVPPTVTPVPTATPVPTPTPNPAAVLTAEGEALFWQSDFAGAEKALREAIDLDPQAVDSYQALALLYYFMPGKETAALEAAEKSVELAPDDAEAQAALARALWNLYRYDEALEAAQKAVELDAESVAAQVSLARASQLLRYQEESLAAAERAVTLDSSNSLAQHALSTIHQAMWSKEQALAEAHTAAALQPTFAPWQAELADVYWRLLDDEVQARAYLTEALTLDSTSVWAQDLLAEIEVDAGNYEAASDLCNQIKELAPEAADGYVCQGSVFRAQEKYDEAVAELEQAIEVAPDSLDGASDLAWTQLLQEDYDEAIAGYEALLEDWPRDGGLYYGLAMAKLWSGDAEGALPEIEKAIELEPNDPSNRVVLGDVYGALDKPDQAEAAYQQAIKMDPEDAWSEFSLFIFYEDQGRTEQALRHLERAAALDPPGYAYELGRYLYIEGDYGQALEHLQHALGVGDNRDTVYFVLGITLAEIGDYEQAQQTYESGQEIYPDSWRIHLGLGDLYMRQDRCEDANAEFELVLEQDPENEVAQQAWQQCNEILHPAPTPVPGATPPPTGAITQAEANQLAKEAITKAGATPDEISFEKSEGTWTWIVSYVTPHTPDSDEFKALQEQIVLAVCEILVRVEPKVSDLAAAAVDKENGTFKGVYIMSFVLEQWQAGTLTDQEFVDLWLPIEG